ncbi:MAG TPA: efflux RND transporter periplasmic adaptor subunit [Kiritimatiellia bacterium]|nr:efflux RND transporter periplasmic adaptor subunit [Kiritimatiellia bacterium]
MRLNKKQWAGIAAVLLVLVLAGRSCYRTGGTSTASSLYAQVDQGPLVVTVRAAGEILSRDANRIIPRIKRGAVVAFMVPEGSRVSKGDVIAQFATEEMDRRISEAEATLSDRELRVVSARTDLEIQLLDNANGFKLANQAVSDAEMEWKKFLEGDEPKDLRNAELRIATTISKFDRSVKKYAEAKELLKEGFITEDQVEEERIAMETAEVDAESARLEMAILKEYDLPLRRNKIDSTLNKARTELEKTTKLNEVHLQNREQALDNAIRMRDRALLELDNLVKEREDFDVRAPIDGVVNYGDPANPWRRGDIQAGMNWNQGEVLMTIPNMSDMQAIINVPEADVDKISPGQSAMIYVEAMGRRTFSGEVHRVAEVANPGGWMSTDVKEFRVEITIPNGVGLRPGFTCDVEITVDRIESALLLPIQAVFRDGEQWVVFKGSASRAEKVPVAIGRTSVTQVQILDGLKKGDRVLLNPPGSIL